MDTFFVKPVFLNEGICTLYVKPVMHADSVEEKSVILVIDVLPEKPILSIENVSINFISYVGKSDTLSCVVKNKVSDEIINFFVNSTPAFDESHLYLIDSETDSSTLIVFTPDRADSFNLTVHARSSNMEDSLTIAVGFTMRSLLLLQTFQIRSVKVFLIYYFLLLTTLIVQIHFGWNY